MIASYYAGRMLLKSKRELDMALQIESVDKGSNAEAAGLLVGDIIISVNDRKVDAVSELVESIFSAGKGTVNFMRSGVQMNIDVTAGKLGCWMVPVNEPDYSVGSMADNQDKQPLIGEWKFSTRYGMNQVISTVSMLLGWLMVFSGAAYLLIKGGDSAMAALMLSAFGLAVVQLSQISRAITDTADHTREAMNLLAAQNRK